MRACASSPSSRAADELRREPALVANFVEECLRLEGPIKGSFRLSLVDTRLGGVDVPAGTILMAVVGAANRDPRVFDESDRFDARRQRAAQRRLRHGEHFCPGASLARTEARISFERLLERLDGIELASARRRPTPRASSAGSRRSRCACDGARREPRKAAAASDRGDSPHGVFDPSSRPRVERRTMTIARTLLSGACLMIAAACGGWR